MLEEYKRLAKIWIKMTWLKILKNGEMSAFISKYECSTHEQSPPSTDAKANRRHGWVTKLDEQTQ